MSLRYTVETSVTKDDRKCYTDSKHPSARFFNRPKPFGADSLPALTFTIDLLLSPARLWLDS
jgi:hypothetical protein